MRETLLEMRRRLEPVLGRDEARAVIRLIFHNLKGWSASDMIIHEGDTLSDYMRSEVGKIVDRVLLGEPIQYILGETEFCGLRLNVGPGVLIPRPETAGLVDLVTARYADRRDLRVLDLCTGSGAIAIALARALPFSDVTAIDISPKALEFAKENVAATKTSVRLLHADIMLWEPLQDSFDIIVSNPPYVCEEEKKDMEVNVKEFEPAEALFVPDDDPMCFYRRIADIAGYGLRPGGRLYLEINSRFSSQVTVLLRAHNFEDVQILKDFRGNDRYAICRKRDNR